MTRAFAASRFAARAPQAEALAGFVAASAIIEVAAGAATDDRAADRIGALGPAVGNDIVCGLTWCAALTMGCAAACRFACIFR